MIVSDGQKRAAISHFIKLLHASQRKRRDLTRQA